MRLRNVKNKNEIMASSKVLILNPMDYKGKWSSVFNNDNPIHVEIGMGKGNFLIGMAEKYPDINFIGIEKYDSVIVRALEKIDFKENLKMIRMNANEIEEVFDKEISRIYLNFSDPWPKVRHHERRLTSFTFLKKYDAIFKTSPEIYQKTDNRDLFEYSIVSLSTYGYHFPFITFDLHHSSVEDNVLTEYESRFVSEGLPIYFLVAKK